MNVYMTDRANIATTPDGKKTSHGAIAQLGERLPCTQEVGGSIPPGSTIIADSALERRSHSELCVASLRLDSPIMETGETVASDKSLNERKTFPLKICCSLTIWKFLTS